MAGDRDLQRRANELIGHADRYNNVYQWNWLGLPIIQQPEDILLIQDLIWNNQPDVVIETGVAWGGSAILLASILTLMGKPGRVVSVDIEIRPHNRRAITAHPMAKDVTLVDGDSTDPATLDAVRAALRPGDKVMAALDSDHRRDHVLAELRAYGPLVTPGQSLVVSDTRIAMADPPEHRRRRWKRGDDPLAALQLFLEESDAFVVDEAANNRLLMTASPGGYLRRLG